MIILLAGLTSLTGCGSNQKETASSQSSSADTASVSTEQSHEGEVVSKLTGLWVPEEVGVRRPIAVMINNIKVALPQSGIEQADIMYEALVEGGITRLMGIYQDYTDIEKLGPVRSARHYYVDFAKEYNAIYTHYGQTKYAISEMDKTNIDTFSGLSSLGDEIFFRDNTRKAPHNAYINSKGLLLGFEKKKYETVDNNLESHFLFQEEEKSPDGQAANTIKLGFSTYSNPWFTYDLSKKQYLRFQYDEKQIDDQIKDKSNNQLAYKNVIIQLAKEWDIDKNGYQTMELNGEGKGYYASLGSYIPITWKKDEGASLTTYYDENGNEIKLNLGKTWVAIFPMERSSHVTFQ